MVPLQFTDLYNPDHYIDTKAVGFSARVLQATHWPSGQEVALKVMRREHQHDPRVWEQFVTEAELLVRLGSTGTVVALVDCGYLSDQAHESPAEGEIVSYNQAFDQFRHAQALYIDRHWRPYLAVELLPAEGCLLNLVRGIDGDGRQPLRLPTEEALALAIQFTEFLAQAHAANIVYWDHKPEHVYWLAGSLRLIDLNVSRTLAPELSPASLADEKGKDLQYMLSGVIYTALTGRDFRFFDQAPQPTPSAPKMVEVRFNGITALEFAMEETLLPALTAEINGFLVAPAARLSAAVLLESFRRSAAFIGWEAGYPVTESARAARAEIQQGLAALRRAQADIREARKHFLQARTLNPEDRESERLYREASEFYRHRVVP